MFRIFVVLGTVFMILLIIIYWDDVGASHLYSHTPVSPGPKMSPPPAVPPRRPQTSRAPSFLSDIDAFVNQFLEPGTGEPTDQAPADASNQSERAEERYIPRQEWKVHLSPVAAELRDRQVGFLSSASAWGIFSSVGADAQLPTDSLFSICLGQRFPMNVVRQSGLGEEQNQV